jgi:hypothetical protein
MPSVLLEYPEAAGTGWRRAGSSGAATAQDAGDLDAHGRAVPTRLKHGGGALGPGGEPVHLQRRQAVQRRPIDGEDPAGGSDGRVKG